MNPQMLALMFFQSMYQQGMSQQQVQQLWQQAQQMAAQQQAGGAAGGGGGLLGQLSTLLGASGELGAEKGPFDMQMQAARIGMDPSAISSDINRLTRPLNRNLINSITRATSPGIAERGLATSPGMSQAITAEALAPYQLQEQQMGQEAFFRGQEQPFKVGSGVAGQYPSDIANLGYLMSIIGSQA